MPAKKAASKKEMKNTSSPEPNNDKLQQALIDNSIALQKVMTNLSLKLDNLSDQILKLLDLFEISAKSFAEKDFEGEASTHRKIIEKLDELIAENKKISEIQNQLPNYNTNQNYQNVEDENEYEDTDYEENTTDLKEDYPQYRPLPKY